MSVDPLVRRAPPHGDGVEPRRRGRLPARPAPAEPTHGPFRVFLLDDHEVARRGLADLIGSTDDLVVVGEAASRAEALVSIPVIAPDVALLDVELPDGSGIDVCRRIRSDNPRIHCLVLTSDDDDRALVPAVLAGAAGCLGKQARGSTLLDALRRVARGQSLLSPRATRQLLGTSSGRAGPGGSTPDGLTEREGEVLGLIADGLTNRQIATELALAEKTVKKHVSAVLTKLGLERRTQAAVYGDRLRAGVG